MALVLSKRANADIVRARPRPSGLTGIPSAGVALVRRATSPTYSRAFTEGIPVSQKPHRLNQRFLRYIRSLFFSISLLIGVLTPQVASANEVVILVNERFQKLYLQFLDNRAPTEIHNYKSPYMRSNVLELVLMIQAIRLGGFKSEIKFQPEKSYNRSLREVKKGKAICTAGLAWKEDLNAISDFVYISRPFIEEGEHILGFYTHKKHQAIYSKMGIATFTQLRVLTNAQWKYDIAGLSYAGFSNLIFAPNWSSMTKMMKAGRADLVLAPFQTGPDMSIQTPALPLYPVEGIGIVIPGSRHWPISRKHPQGKAFYDALERGLIILEKSGTIERAYREAELIHPMLEKWTLLNAH